MKQLTRYLKLTLFPVVAFGSSLFADCCEDFSNNCFGYSYNPPPQEQGCCGWSGDFEFLYFKPFQEGLGFGTLYSTSAGPSIDSVGNQPVFGYQLPGNFSGEDKELCFEWNAGFRLGLGYKMPCDCFGFSLVYTHFQSKAKGSTSSFYNPFLGQGTLFSPTFSILGSGYYVNNADTKQFFEFTSQEVNANWNLRYNVLDFVIDREFFVGPCLSLKPNLGLRALFVQEKVSFSRQAAVTAILDDSGDPMTTLSISETISLKEFFKGVGIEAGIDSDWTLGCGFTLYGRFSTALVYGRYKTTGEDCLHSYGTFGEGAEPFLQNDQLVNRHNYYTFAPMIDLGLGLKFSEWVFLNKVFKFELGWEEHLLFSYNKFKSFAVPGQGATNQQRVGQEGNLILNGIRIAFSLDF